MLRTTLVLFITLVGLSFCLYNPFYGLLLYTWYSFASPLDLTYGILADTKLSLVVAIFFITITYFSNKTIFRNNVLTYSAILGTYNIKTIFSNVEYLYKVAIISIIAPVVLKNAKNIKWYIVTIIGTVGILAFYYGVFGLFSGSTYISGAGRIGDNNGYALLLTSTIPLAVGLFLIFKEKILKLIILIIIIGLLSALFLTFSRGGLIGFVVILILMIFNIKKRYLLGFLFIASLSLYTLTSFDLLKDLDEFSFKRDFRQGSSPLDALDYYRVRIYTLLDNPSETESGSSRIHFWRVAIEMAMDNPILGVGINNYQSKYDEYDFLEGQYGTGRSVHNSFFIILAEMGYTGFLILIFIIVTIFYKLFLAKIKLHKLLFDNQDEDLNNLRILIPYIQISLIGFMVSGFFVIGIYQEIFWVFVTLAIAIDIVVSKKFNDNNSNEITSNIT